MPTKAAKETKTPKEAKASKETKASTETKTAKAPKADKARSSKVEPVSKEGQKPNALQKLLQPSKELAAVVGAEPLKDPLISSGCICMDDEVVLLNKGSFIEQYDRRNETHMHAVQGCQELSRQYSF